MSRTFKSLALVIALLLLGTGSSAASFDYTDRDPRGDVEGHTPHPQPEPCGSVDEVEPANRRVNDIRGLSVRTEGGGLTLVLQFRELPALRRHLALFHIRTRKADFSTQILRVRQRTLAVLFREDPPPEPDECGLVGTLSTARNCPDLTGRISRAEGRIRLTVPLSCLRSPRWVRIGAEAHHVKRGTTFSDVWAPRGSKPQGSWGHVYGPRLRTGA